VKDDIKRVVRSEKYKLHHNLLTKSLELYNLANDPKERFNIASEKSSIVDLLLVELKKFMQMSNSGEESVDLTPEEIEKLKRLGYI
jgi:arylsulfatase A-like enzyme